MPVPHRLRLRLELKRQKGQPFPKFRRFSGKGWFELPKYSSARHYTGSSPYFKKKFEILLYTYSISRTLEYSRSVRGITNLLVAENVHHTPIP